jgi:hypothetical protein
MADKDDALLDYGQGQNNRQDLKKVEFKKHYGEVDPDALYVPHNEVYEEKETPPQQTQAKESEAPKELTETPKPEKKTAAKKSSSSKE